MHGHSGHDWSVGEIVVVTGADGPIGHRVVSSLLLDPGVDEVVAVGRGARAAAWDPITAVVPTRLVVAPWNLDDRRLGPTVAEATAVLLLGPRGGLDIDGTGGAEIDVHGTRALLGDLSGSKSLRFLLLLSSALVYGARRDNPVPLTERARVRPNPSIAAAMERVTLERVCVDWSTAQGLPCAVLRPSVVVGPENGAWLARSPWSTSGLQVSDRTGPVQFLHMDDLVSAVDTLRSSRFDGPINAAPDGWLTASQVSALKGPVARLRLSRTLAVLLADIGARLGLAPGDPSMLVASSAPWVVANDELRSMGWVPSFTNEEAYVDSDRGGFWARLTPRNRQQMALGGAAVGALTIIGTVAAILRRQVRVDR